MYNICIFLTVETVYCHGTLFVILDSINQMPVSKALMFWSDPLCHSQMEKRKDPKSVDIKKILLDMRRYRMGLIQTADQLRFSYMAVKEGAKYSMGDSSVQVHHHPSQHC